MSWFVVEGING